MEKLVKYNIYRQLGAALQQAREGAGLSLDDITAKNGYSSYKLAFIELGNCQYLSRMPIWSLINLLELYGRMPIFDTLPIPSEETAAKKFS